MEAHAEAARRKEIEEHQRFVEESIADEKVRFMVRELERLERIENKIKHQMMLKDVNDGIAAVKEQWREEARSQYNARIERGQTALERALEIAEINIFVFQELVEREETPPPEPADILPAVTDKVKLNQRNLMMLTNINQKPFLPNVLEENPN